MVKMSDLTDSDIAKPDLRKYLSEYTWIKTSRLMINLLTNILICLTVFVSLLYGFNTKSLTAIHLHIILCVLGYQLLMCQGTLVVSKFNSWSVYLSRRHRTLLHVVFQFMGFMLAAAGSCVMMVGEHTHFNSTHGYLGIIALIMSCISMLNGASAKCAFKLSMNYVLLIKYIHYASGILSLFVSASALTTGFETSPFRFWLSNDKALIALIGITYLFTLLVAIDFWLLTGQRLQSLMGPLSKK